MKGFFPAYPIKVMHEDSGPGAAWERAGLRMAGPGPRRTLFTHRQACWSLSHLPVPFSPDNRRMDGTCWANGRMGGSPAVKASRAATPGHHPSLQPRGRSHSPPSLIANRPLDPVRKRGGPGGGQEGELVLCLGEASRVPF